MTDYNASESGIPKKKPGPVEILRGKPAARPRGRPTVYTDAIAQEVCQRLSAGETLTQICKDAHLPDDATVRMWAVTDLNGFSRAYNEARRALMEYWSEEIIDISDDTSLEPNDRRVRVDARRWLMSKLYPQRYGDKLIHSGDVENPVQIMHRNLGTTPLSDVELAALERFTSARMDAIDVTPSNTSAEPDKPD